MQASASMNSCIDMSPARTIASNFHTWVPEPICSSRNRPFSIGPPETTSAGRSQLAAPMSRAGVVLSQPASSTTPVEGVGSDGLLDVHAHEVAVEHRRGPHQGLSQGHHGELEGEAALLVDSALDPLRQDSEVRVARGELRPGVADADDRTAVEEVVGQALVLHPASMVEAVLALLAEPLGAAAIARPLAHLSSPGLNRSIPCGRPLRLGERRRRPQRVPSSVSGVLSRRPHMTIVCHGETWEDSMNSGSDDMAEYEAIARSVQHYIDGARAGSGGNDGGRIPRRRADLRFFRRRIVRCSESGSSSIVSTRPARGARYPGRIASIEIANTVATVRLELDQWAGRRFTDFFTLLKIDGTWTIMNKVFHLHNPS